MSRFDLLLSQSTVSSLIQFCVQFGGSLATVSILGTSTATLPVSLLASSLAHLTSLTLAQYCAMLIQSQKSVSWGQR